MKYYYNQYNICLFFITGIHHNHYKLALQKNTESEEFLLSAVSILDSIRYKSDTFSDTLPCLIGWRKAVLCLFNVSNDLRDNHNIHSLITHNYYCQDDVKNFFSRMRSGGGNRDNRTAQEFLAEYRKVTVYSLFTHVAGSNCNLDAGDFLVKLHQLQNIPNTPIPICIVHICIVHIYIHICIVYYTLSRNHFICYISNHQCILSY